MPATRKSTGNASTASSRAKSRPANQTKLAFSNKVTKSASHDLSAKKPATKTSTATPKAQEAPEASIVVSDSEAELESADTSLVSIDLPVALDPIDVTALAIKDAQIKKFYNDGEKGRVAPRVHQNDLPIAEKLLRSWDVDSRYGPCIGIDRVKRWRRAQKFGLKPPIEILAVLLREDKENGGQGQRAHLDEIMGSKFAE